MQRRIVTLAAVLVAAITADLAHGATLLAHYRMEEGTGTSVGDSAGTPQNGTFGNTPTWSTNAAPVPSGSTWALNFDGAASPNGDYVNLAPIDDLEINGSFSIALWVNVDTYSSGTGAAELFGVFQTASPFEHNYLLRMYHSGHPTASLRNKIGFISRDDSGDTVVVDDSAVATLDAWDHYAVTFDGATGATVLYRNGVSVGTGTMPNAPVAINTAQTVARLAGAGTAGGASFDGLLDDARIYTGVLTPTEVGILAGTIVVPVPAALPAGLALFTLAAARRRRRTT